jgi:RimJ/RimL family protein N-acetyltransferase
VAVNTPAAGASVKIRPAGPLWIAFLALGVAALACGADALRNSQPWFAVLWLAAGGISVAVGLALRVAGVDLTPEFAVVRMVRARRVPWPEVQAVVCQQDLGHASLLITFEHGEPQSLPYPGQIGVKGDARCERDCQLINTWWLARRGESWRPADPSASATPPPILPPNTIAGTGVLLREVTVAEVASLLDEQSVQNNCAPDYPFEGSRAAARGFQGRSAGQQHDTHGFGMYQIVRLADGLIIGDIGFHAPPQDGSVEVGFGLAPSARGAGHGSEALRLLVGWAEEQSEVRQVVARTLVDNEPSRAVLCRAGFRDFGRDGDLVHYRWTPPTGLTGVIHVLYIALTRAILKRQ